CESVAVLPSPFPFADSLLDTLAIAHVAAPQVSAASVVTVTGTILWFGGQTVAGDAVTLVIAGGVLSTTVTAVASAETCPKASTAERAYGGVTPSGWLTCTTGSPPTSAPRASRGATRTARCCPRGPCSRSRRA